MRAALLAALLAAPASAADADRAVSDSYGAFLQGRYEDAASGWRYLQGLGVTAPRPEANEALAERDAARPEASLPLWIKASLSEGADGFVWNQRGWAALSAGLTREAKEAFERAVDRSSSTATQAEAALGLGMTALAAGKPKTALEPLRRAGTAGPYAIASSAQLTAEASLASGDKQSALAYYRQAVEVDPYNREALRALMRLLARIGDNRAAHAAARRALAMDPADEEALKVLKRASSYLTGDLDAASGVRRQARPLLDPDGGEEAPAASARTVRVGLYGAPDGRPASMTRCYVMMNSPFKVTAAAYGTLRDNGNAFDQWEVEYRADSGQVEVRDASRNLLFVSKQPFKFAPSGRRGSVLIKSARIPEPAGVDVGDREVRGAVEVHPNPRGFRLVQEAPLEPYLYGVVSAALPAGSPPEAYKAQAVVARTAAVWAMGHRAETLEKSDLLDDRSTQGTIGVGGELRAAADAVDATARLVLARGGEVARAPQHEDSGGRTESGAEAGELAAAGLESVSDSPRPLAEWTTPLDLERFVHEAPPEGLFSEAAPGPTAAAARWMRVLDARELRERAERGGAKVGRLKSVRVAGRTPTGRVRALELVGTEGRAALRGFDEIQRVLSPGSLRSSLFTAQPLYEGRHLSRLVLWGAGTGSGLGFPRSGALGQAAMGAAWRDILKRYFPKDEVRDLDRPAAAPAAAPRKAVGPARRTLNYRRKK